MSKSDTFEHDVLDLIFQGTAIANLADNAAAAPLANLYVGLHTADPGEGGTQSTSEATYTGYARQAVARPGGFVRTGSSVSPAAAIVFPAATAGSNTITHWSVGSDAAGAGRLFYSGPVAPNIPVSAPIAPNLTTASTITED